MGDNCIMTTANRLVVGGPWFLCEPEESERRGSAFKKYALRGTIWSDSVKLCQGYTWRKYIGGGVKICLVEVYTWLARIYRERFDAGS